MTLLLSQLSVNLVLSVLSILSSFQSSAPATSSKTQPPPNNNTTLARAWSLHRLISAVFLSVETPLIALFHPIIFLGTLQVQEPLPGLPFLINQVLGFLLLDYAGYRWLPRFQPIDAKATTRQPESQGAFELATEHIVPKTSLILGMVIMGYPSLLSRVVGPLHIASIIVWLIIRHYRALVSGP